MTQHPRLLFLLADGGRARFVVRDHDSRHFKTLAVMEAPEPALSGGSSGGRAAVFQRFGRGRDTTQRSPDRKLKADAAFARDCVAEALATASRQAARGIVLAAPPRILSALQKAFPDGRIIVGSLPKDLTKAPDSELGDWLDSAELSARPTA